MFIHVHVLKCATSRQKIIGPQESTFWTLQTELVHFSKKAFIFIILSENFAVFTTSKKKENSSLMHITFKQHR